MNIAFYYLAAYLLGTIPFGLIVTYLVRRIDIRQHGSHNIGATNVFRVVGKTWGIIVFILDALKGYFAVQLFSLIENSSPLIEYRILFAICAILGHSFPIWLRFKGGKGVATSLGAFLAVSLTPTLLTFAIWILVFLLVKILSVASLSAAVAFPFVILLSYRTEQGFVWLLLVSLFLCAFIFYTHRSNLKRLKDGTEKRLF